MREDAAAVTRRDDVDAEMAERSQFPVLRRCDEPSQSTARDVLEEHALHGIPRAEPEDLLALGLDESSGHRPEDSRSHRRRRGIYRTATRLGGTRRVPA